jgi:hypothetical protein
MPAISPANFLNLDLEMESRSDLSSLAEYFARAGVVLYNGPCPNGYRLAVEPDIEGSSGPDAEVCTKHFIALASSLPEHLYAAWRDCVLRVFDYGFVGGIESTPVSMSISPESLQLLVQLGVGVRVTIYPYRDAP